MKKKYIYPYIYTNTYIMYKIQSHYNQQCLSFMNLDDQHFTKTHKNI